MVAGDFNDETCDRSIREVLGAVQQGAVNGVPADALYFSTAPGPGDRVGGSIKYRGRWYLFDHVFYSSGLAEMKGTGLFIPPGSVNIFMPDFLLERDRQWTGWKPLRTWMGWKYQAGFSDHLPLTADLYCRESGAD